MSKIAIYKLWTLTVTAFVTEQFSVTICDYGNAASAEVFN